MKTSMGKVLLIGAMATAVAGFVATANAADKMADKEKCWGVAKAGKNDCKSHANACAGQATKDGESFVIVPKGLCAKLVGGHTS